MDFPCETEITVRNDNALLFSVVTEPVPVIEYLKTIASLIGASHILGVFEDEKYIKVYFDDKKYVDTLIRSGIHVMGHHIKVEYAVPPGNKVILSNIDPVVSNQDLIRLMSMFGSVVSPVFRSPISDDIELCHIDYGVRYVYVDLNVHIPEYLEFKYGDLVCKINIKVDDSLQKNALVKNEPVESNITESSSTVTFVNNSEPINIDDDLDVTDPVVISVQSSIEEVNSEKQDTTLQPRIEANSIVTVPQTRNLYKTRRAKLIRASKNNKRIKHNVKYKNKRVKKINFSRRGLNRNIACITESSQSSLKSLSSSSICVSNPDDSLISLSTTIDDSVCDNFKDILDEEKFKLFLEEVRHHRAPIEIVKKYLEPNFDSDALHSLIEQINVYRRKCDLSAKTRMRRLVHNLKSYLETF